MNFGVQIPADYKRGPGVLDQVGQFCKERASRVFIAGGKRALAAVEDQLLANLENAGLEVIGPEWYGGECTWANIEKVNDLAVEENAELIIAVGGGKALDTGKGAAYKAGLPCVTIPTIAATCAAFTPLSIIHNEDGVYVENTPLSACPVGIFVDSQIIMDAPDKWLYAGMGDTLAKWYELRATTGNIPTTSGTLGGIQNGKICYDIIKEFGSEAKSALDEEQINPGLGYVIDAIILYAGMSSILGGEKCRGAASHSIYFGFTNIPTAHHKGHGLLVGFGNLCLLALEERSDLELTEEIKLARECGVPTRLSDIADLSQEDLELVAKVACQAADMKNMPMEVRPKMVIEAIQRVDKLSKTI